jgi:putative transposase
MERPGKWNEVVNRSLRDDELTGLRTSVQRGRPFGSGDWVMATAERLGLECILRGRGRPRAAGGTAS